MTPPAKFSAATSLIATSRLAISRASGFVRSSWMLRFPWLYWFQ